MSRRPLAPFEIQENVAIDRMVAGGRRWSESPIGRPAFRRPRAPGLADNPLYWWKFDDGGGTSAAEATVAAFDMNFWEEAPAIPYTPVWGAGIAPGSSGAVTLEGLTTTRSYGYLTSTASGPYRHLLPGADGLIVFDWWMDGHDVGTDGQGERRLLDFNVGGASDVYVAANDTPGTLVFALDGTPVTTLAGVVGPSHVRWEIRPEVDTTGTSAVYVDGVLEDTQAGLDFYLWTAGIQWDLYLYSAGTTHGVTYDEFKMYGTAAAA